MPSIEPDSRTRGQGRTTRFRARRAAPRRFASQPTSRTRDDGLTSTDCWVTAAVRCASPANRPTPAERDTGAAWLREELALLPARVPLALGGFARDAVLREPGPVRPNPRLGRGRHTRVGTYELIGRHHPRQQHTFTGS